MTVDFGTVYLVITALLYGAALGTMAIFAHHDRRKLTFENKARRGAAMVTMLYLAYAFADAADTVIDLRPRHFMGPVIALMWIAVCWTIRIKNAREKRAEDEEIIRKLREAARQRADEPPA